MQQDSLAEIPPGWYVIWKVQDGKEIRGLSRMGRISTGCGESEQLFLWSRKSYFLANELNPIAN